MDISLKYLKESQMMKGKRMIVYKIELHTIAAQEKQCQQGLRQCQEV